jgi:hypothetical protein
MPFLGYRWKGIHFKNSSSEVEVLDENARII